MQPRRTLSFLALSLLIAACGGETSETGTDATNPGGSAAGNSASGGSGGASSTGGSANGNAGTTSKGGSSAAGAAQGGQAQAGQAQGGQAQGGQAQGGQAQAGQAQGGQAQGGQAQGGQGQGGGTSFPCCVSHMVTTCNCPPGAACDPLPYEVCSDGSCAPLGETCPGTKSCGGLGGGTCASDEFCDYPDNMCGAADGQGTCVKRPTVCDQSCGAVATCGCDGNEYCNPCMANAAGTDTTNGPCGGTSVPCCQNGIVSTCECAPGTACGFPPFTDCGGGVCVALGDKCPAGQACGGPNDPPCAANEFCNFVSNSCGGPGFCETRPDACPLACSQQGICGCDGQSYCNGCEAHASGSDDTGAPCGGTSVPCCQGGFIATCTCDPGLDCGFPPFTDCGSGVCVDLGQTCPAIKVCGGKTGATCAADEFCDYPDAMCGFADGTGVCKPRPSCAGNCDATPACGCDGQQYCGVCDAQAKGVDAEPCPGTTFPCCLNGTIQTCDCPPGAICDPVPFNDCGNGICTLFNEPCPTQTPCFDNSGCAKDEFCNFDGASCGASLQGGVCAKRPTACPELCAPAGICGCDGQSYCSGCDANAAGIDDMGMPCPTGNEGDLCSDKLACGQGLLCCYPCGQPGCSNQCMKPDAGGGCPLFP